MLRLFASLPIALIFIGCSTYHQNIMFRTPEGFAGAPIRPEALKAERNYVIQVNDYLRLEVYSNKGERIVDPNGELVKGDGGVVTPAVQTVPSYLVTTSGVVRFPMIEPVTLEGLTISQAEDLLRKEYDKFYKECYVVLSFSNKRVVVLGNGGGQVIPLVNENVALTEVLALAKSIDNESKAHNIRVIRGEEVFLIDLSTIDGVRKGNMIIQPGDIVYVEPVRRPFAESFRDVAPFLSFVFSLSTLIVVFLNNQN